MKRALCFIASLLLILSVLPITVLAAAPNRPYADCESEYERVGDIIPEVSFGTLGSGTSTAGMAVVGDYAYTVKLKGNAKPEGDTTNYHMNEPSVIFRFNLVTGEMVRMTPLDAEEGKNYITYLHHANGMCGYELDGKIYIMAVTMVSGNQALVKLLVEGTTYRKVGEYEIMEGTKSVNRSGIDLLSVDGEKAELLLKSGKTFSTATLPHSQTDGKVNATIRFTVDMSALTVGETKIDASTGAGFVWQDCGYHDGILYVPVSGPSAYYSMIGVFEIFNEDGSMKSGNLKPVPGKSINLGGFCYKIEIESVAIGNDGKLYFNANANRSAGVKLFDGVFRLVEPKSSDDEPQPEPQPQPPAEGPTPENTNKGLIITLSVIGGVAGVAVLAGAVVLVVFLSKKKKV